MKINKELILIFTLISIMVLTLTACSGSAFNSGRIDLASSKDLDKAETNIVTCTDSDDGIIEEIKGVTTFKTDKMIDYCQDNILIEYYCSKDGMLLNERIPCEFGCDDGTCLDFEDNTTNQTSCYDSDGGFNYYVQGTCNDSEGYVMTDYCYNAVLTEFICGNENQCVESHNSPFNCPYGCSNGACIEDEINETNSSLIKILEFKGIEDSDELEINFLPYGYDEVSFVLFEDGSAENIFVNSELSNIFEDEIFFFTGENLVTHLLEVKDIDIDDNELDIDDLTIGVSMTVNFNNLISSTIPLYPTWGTFFDNSVNFSLSQNGPPAEYDPQIFAEYGVVFSVPIFDDQSGSFLIELEGVEFEVLYNYDYSDDQYELYDVVGLDDYYNSALSNEDISVYTISDNIYVEVDDEEDSFVRIYKINDLVSECSSNADCSSNKVCDTIYTHTCVDCYETDGGINYIDQGTIFVSQENGQSWSRRTETDFCRDDTHLYEWYCNPNGPNGTGGILRSETNVLCEFGCSNGACIYNETNGTETISPTLTSYWEYLDNGFRVVLSAYDESGLSSIGGDFEGPGMPAQGSSHSCQGSTTCNLSFILEQGYGNYTLTGSASDIYGNGAELISTNYFDDVINEVPLLNIQWVQLDDGFRVVLSAYDDDGLSSIGGELSGPGPTSGIGSGHSCQGNTYCNLTLTLENGPGLYSYNGSASDIIGATTSITEFNYFDNLSNQSENQGIASLLLGYDRITLENNENYYYAGTGQYIQLMIDQSGDFVILTVDGTIVSIDEHDGHFVEGLNVFIDEIHDNSGDMSVSLLLNFMDLTLEIGETANVVVDGDDYSISLLDVNGPQDIAIISVNGDTETIEEFEDMAIGGLSVYAELIASSTI